MCRRRTVHVLWVYAPKTRSRSASEAGCPFVCHSPHYCCPPPAARPHLRASLRRRQPVRWVLTPPLLPASGIQTAAPSVLSLPSELLHSLPEPRTLTCEILRIKPFSLFSKFHRLANIQLKSLPKQLMIFSIIIYRNNFCT